MSMSDNLNPFITKKQKSLWRSKAHRDLARHEYTAVNVQKLCDVPGCTRTRYGRSRWCRTHRNSDIYWGHPQAGAFLKGKEDSRAYQQHRKRALRFLKKHDWHPAVIEATRIMRALIDHGVEKGWREATRDASGVLPVEKHVVSRAGWCDGTTIDLADRELTRLRVNKVDPVKCLATLIASQRHAYTAIPRPWAGRDIKALKYAMANEVFKLAHARRPFHGREGERARNDPKQCPPAPGNARRICGELFQGLLGTFIINVNSALDAEDNRRRERTATLTTPFPSQQER